MNKPDQCPFCGGEVQVATDNSCWWVECHACGCIKPEVESEATAIANWNSRETPNARLYRLVNKCADDCDRLRKVLALERQRHVSKMNWLIKMQRDDEIDVFRERIAAIDEAMIPEAKIAHDSHPIDAPCEICGTPRPRPSVK